MPVFGGFNSLFLSSLTWPTLPVLLKVSPCYKGAFPCPRAYLGVPALGFSLCKAAGDNFDCKITAIETESESRQSLEVQ